MQPTAPNFATDLARRLPADTLSRIEAHQEDWLRACGEGFGYGVLAGPVVTTTTAVQLCGAYGLDCEVPWLARQAQDGRFVMPRAFGVEFAWTGDDLVRLFRHLVAEKRFFPGCWDHCKTADEIAAERREVEQAMKMAEHFATLSVDELQRLEDQVTSKHAGVMLRTVLRSKLSQQTTKATECEPLPSSR